MRKKIFLKMGLLNLFLLGLTAFSIGQTPASEAFSNSDVVESILQLQQGPPEPTQFRLTKPYAVLRVYPDGIEEPVRGIDMKKSTGNYPKLPIVGYPIQ